MVLLGNFAQVAWDKRTTQHMVPLGQGGTGKTMLVQEIFIPLVEWAFPADEHGDRWLVVAYSHAQADAISKGKIRARTLHNACAMRVQSLANTKMAPGAKKETLIRTWGNKVFLVDEEISMMPAEALNMEMHRAAWGRNEKCGVEIDSYAEKECLFDRMPLVVLLGDFLQLKPPRSICLVDALIAKAREGKVVSVEAQAACDAFRQTANVIEALKQASGVLEPHGIVMVCEPLNWRDHRGQFLRYTPQSIGIMEAVDSPSCRILQDLYHQQATEGNLIDHMNAGWDHIPYFQVGDNPGRREPGTGEINYANVFKHMHSRGYDGIVGMEHGKSIGGKEGEVALIEAYRSVDPADS